MANFIHRTTMQLVLSVHTTDLITNEDYMIIPTSGEVQAALGIPQKYRKIVSSAIVEKTATEKTAVDAAISEAAAQTEEDKKDVGKSPNLLFRSLALCMLDELNIIRENASLEPRTVDNFRAAIIAKYNAISG